MEGTWEEGELLGIDPGFKGKEPGLLERVENWGQHHRVLLPALLLICNVTLRKALAFSV